MSSSSVYLTPCWAGKKPLIRVERAGEHMQALVKARSKLTPCWRSRRIPGRFWRSQLGGKCWIARSWSVRMRTMFIPATSRSPPFAGAERPLDAGALGEQRRGGGAGAGPEQLLAGQALLRARSRLAHLFLLKTSTASLSNEVE